MAVITAMDVAASRAPQASHGSPHGARPLSTSTARIQAARTRPDVKAAMSPTCMPCRNSTGAVTRRQSSSVAARPDAPKRRVRSLIRCAGFRLSSSV